MRIGSKEISVADYPDRPVLVLRVDHGMVMGCFRQPPSWGSSSTETKRRFLPELLREAGHDVQDTDLIWEQFITRNCFAGDQSGTDPAHKGIIAPAFHVPVLERAVDGQRNFFPPDERIGTRWKDEWKDLSEALRLARVIVLASSQPVTQSDMDVMGNLLDMVGRITPVPVYGYDWTRLEPVSEESIRTAQSEWAAHNRFLYNYARIMHLIALPHLREIIESSGEQQERWRSGPPTVRDYVDLVENPFALQMLHVLRSTSGVADPDNVFKIVRGSADWGMEELNARLNPFIEIQGEDARFSWYGTGKHRPFHGEYRSQYGNGPVMSDERLPVLNWCDRLRAWGLAAMDRSRGMCVTERCDKLLSRLDASTFDPDVMLRWAPGDGRLGTPDDEKDMDGWLESAFLGRSHTMRSVSATPPKCIVRKVEPDASLMAAVEARREWPRPAFVDHHFNVLMVRRYGDDLKSWWNDGGLTKRAYAPLDDNGRRFLSAMLGCGINCTFDEVGGVVGGLTRYCIPSEVRWHDLPLVKDAEYEIVPQDVLHVDARGTYIDWGMKREDNAREYLVRTVTRVTAIVLDNKAPPDSGDLADLGRALQMSRGGDWPLVLHYDGSVARVIDHGVIRDAMVRFRYHDRFQWSHVINMRMIGLRALKEASRITAKSIPPWSPEDRLWEKNSIWKTGTPLAIQFLHLVAQNSNTDQLAGTHSQGPSEGSTGNSPEGGQTLPSMYPERYIGLLPGFVAADGGSEAAAFRWTGSGRYEPWIATTRSSDPASARGTQIYKFVKMAEALVNDGVMAFDFDQGASITHMGKEYLRILGPGIVDPDMLLRWRKGDLLGEDADGPAMDRWLKNAFRQVKRRVAGLPPH